MVPVLDILLLCIQACFDEKWLIDFGSRKHFALLAMLAAFFLIGAFRKTYSALTDTQALK